MVMMQRVVVASQEGVTQRVLLPPDDINVDSGGSSTRPAVECPAVDGGERVLLPPDGCVRLVDGVRLVDDIGHVRVFSFKLRFH